MALETRNEQNRKLKFAIHSVKKVLAKLTDTDSKRASDFENSDPSCTDFDELCLDEFSSKPYFFNKRLEV